jgi:Spy/CpxP family protein refolding chaperone
VKSYLAVEMECVMRRITLIGFALAVGSSACAHTGSGDPGATADQAASELREHHRHHHQGGVTQFIAMSLDTLGTDDAKQPQVDKIESDLFGCMAPARDIEKSLLGKLADGVAAGQIDDAQVDATIAQLRPAAEAVHDCASSSLNKLHAILSPTERAVVVDKVQANYEVWRQVNHEAEAGGQEKGGRLADLADELDLTPEQVEKMSNELRVRFAGPRSSAFDPKQTEAHLQAFETAFASESFDAKSITTNANGHLASHGARRMALFYETVAPLLTPDQRTLLAQHLRQRADYQPVVAGK